MVVILLCPYCSTDDFKEVFTGSEKFGTTFRCSCNSHLMKLCDMHVKIREKRKEYVNEG